MIGDRPTDMEAANSAGCHGILYSKGQFAHYG